MIVLDTSVIIAIAFEEEDEERISRFIATQQAIVGTPTLVEVGTVLTRLERSAADRFLATFLARRSIAVVDFTRPMFEAAREAFRLYGKGRHPAKLNLGDCMSYAVARVQKLPLFFKGQGFSQTDIEPAWRP